jgi:hypothetical protein
MFQGSQDVSWYRERAAQSAAMGGIIPAAVTAVGAGIESVAAAASIVGVGAIIMAAIRT